MTRFFACLVFLAPLAACGGIVDPAPGGPTSTPSPSAEPSATTGPSSSAPVPGPAGDDVSCWSPGPPTVGPAPVVTGGQCSMVGTWDYAASAGATGSLSFDADGNWVGGAAGADLCSPQAQSMSGTYSLQGDEFDLVTIHDKSACGGDWGMFFQAAFDGPCTHATLTETGDNCTGARTEFNSNLTLTRR